MAARGAFIAFGLLFSEPLLAQEPLSAIDWLKQTPTVTLDIGQSPLPEHGINIPNVATTALSPSIGVEILDKAGRDAVGLLPSSVTGLPASLWQNSSASTLAKLLAQQRVDDLPAIQALWYTLLLAEANPPADAGIADTLLLARIDKLVDLGALEHANALLERAGATTPALFQRWFDVTLLMGQEDAACKALNISPHLSPDYASRIFCRARAGDWMAAALTLDTAKVLDLVSHEEDALLARFLDPTLFEDEPMLVAASKPTPLTFRLYEAIGEPQPTRTLPRAFAHADLRTTSGWKAQLEAAERLARTGALPENHLLGLYTERLPAASGMIWDRVDAVQAFDAAMERRSIEDIEQTLPTAWKEMKDVHLEVPFSKLYGAALLGVPLLGETKALARDIALLSPDYEIAGASGPEDYLAMLAIGEPPKSPSDPTEQAISDAFHGAGVPQGFSTALAKGQLGEVILRTVELMEAGAAGDLGALTHALATLRSVGLEDTARRAAIQVLLLWHRG